MSAFRVALLGLCLLEGLGVTALTSPELTGEWESKLGSMERGELSRKQFMAEIAQMTEDMVAKAKNFEHDTIPGDFGTLTTPCPKCGGVVKENYRRFTCTGKGGGDAEGHTGCGFSMTKIPAGRSFELHEVEQLLREHKLGPLEGFRSKAGWPFTAELKMVKDAELNNWKMEFDFGEDAKKEEESGEGVDFSNATTLGACPKCGGSVYEHGTNYVCEHSVGAHVTCDFKTGKISVGSPLARALIGKVAGDVVEVQAPGGAREVEIVSVRYM